MTPPEATEPIDYARFARFYDRLMGDPTSKSERVLTAIAKFFPEARSVLELGTGTGSILSGLTGLELAGVDRSFEMLDIARRKVPGATFVQADITTFDHCRRYDVVICVFDTLNHLLSAGAWQALFEVAARHFVPGGLFLFDVNTIGRLRRLGEGPPWVRDFDGNTLIMDVTIQPNGMSIWDIRVFEALGQGRYLLHHEAIANLRCLWLRSRRWESAFTSSTRWTQMVAHRTTSPTGHISRAVSLTRRFWIRMRSRGDNGEGRAGGSLRSRASLVRPNLRRTGMDCL